MQEFIEKLFLTIILVLLFFVLLGLVKEANAADYSQFDELYIKNEAGGYIAVTKEPCQETAAIAQGFQFRGYATESNGTKHEGCWAAPDISEAPKHPNVMIIPIVNMYFEGQVIAVPQHQFKPLQELDNSL